jgi:hypothetical protein
MTDRQNTRAIIGRALLASAIVMVMLTILFAAGVIPIDPGVRRAVVALLALVVVTDVLIAMLFFRRGP